MLSEAARSNRVAHFGSHSGLPTAQIKSLGLLHMERIWKGHKSRHPNMTSLRIAIEAAFVGMDSATLQRATENRDCYGWWLLWRLFKLMRDISNNCALQGSPKCHIKRFFVIFNFSLKTFCLKKLFDLSGFWWRTLYIYINYTRMIFKSNFPRNTREQLTWESFLIKIAKKAL